MSYFNQSYYASEFFKSPHFNNKFYGNPFFTGWVWARAVGGAVVGATNMQIIYTKTLVGSVSASKVKLWVNGTRVAINQPTLSAQVLNVTLTAGVITSADRVEIEVIHSISNNLTGIEKSVLVNNL